jgi:DNA-binding response OmpR family regulator
MGKEIALHVDHNHRRQTCICRNLESLGFELHKAATVETAGEKIKRHCYRLVIMHFDTMGKEIFRFCSFVRSGSACTILIVLMADAKINIEEQLFDCGVNDVVAGKHAAPKVLTKRIRAHLHYSKSSCQQTNTIRLKDTVVDFDRREVWCNGATHKLPGILADLLKYFLDNPTRVISREELLGSPIWSDSICSPAKEGGKTFDVNVSKLRKIIEPNPARPQIIISVRGQGWKLAGDVVV